MVLGVYYMSEAGACTKALAASRLGYEPISQSSSGEVVMREGRRHETHIAEDLKALGYELLDAGPCSRCKEEFGREVSGHHVEYENVLLRLVGHLDWLLDIEGQKYPCEFKSMGLFVYQKFLKEGFESQKGYEAQELCYTAMVENPGLYVVKNRDNGQMTLYTVPYLGAIIPGHKVLPVSTTFEEIVDKLNSVEISVRGKELPECTTPEDGRRWCPFRYLCSEPEPKEKVTEVAQGELLEAAALWKEGNELEKQGKDKIEFAKGVLLSQASITPKFNVGGVGVTYRGKKTRATVDTKLLKELVSKEVFSKVQKQSKPYDDISIRELKEGE